MSSTVKQPETLVCAYRKCKKPFVPMRFKQRFCRAQCRMSDWNERNPRERATEERKRSLRADVRNPLLALPSARRLKMLPPQVKAMLYELLEDLSGDARFKAEDCWKKHKAPMAAYWKAVAVLSGHTKRLVR